VPLADAMARVSPALRLLMLAGAAISMLGWLSSDILCSPRIVFALARDHLMPRALGRVHARHHTPHVAIAGYSALAIGLALTGTFSELAVLSTLAIAPLYIAGCAAAWRLARRGVALAGEPLRFRWLGAAVVTGIVSMLLLVALASRAEITGLLVIIAAAVVLYGLQARRMPQRAA
jgi:amino acid transporter